MDKLDSRILNALESDFPLEEKPYDKLAEKLSITTDLLWQHLRVLIDTGIIRRIGASFDSERIGFTSTLAAVSVDKDRVDQAAKVITAFEEVTHCYLRADRFNIWFTIIAPNGERINEILEHIRNRLSLESSQILNVPKKRLFKLDTRFTTRP